LHSVNAQLHSEAMLMCVEAKFPASGTFLPYVSA
jgi:hypothetical protein